LVDFGLQGKVLPLNIAQRNRRSVVHSGASLPVPSGVPDRFRLYRKRAIRTVAEELCQVGFAWGFRRRRAYAKVRFNCTGPVRQGADDPVP
jgi:hypothetical protein